MTQTRSGQADQPLQSQRPQLIVHAGTHKTASTYIQERLHRNRDLLSSHGVSLQDPLECKPKPKKLAAELCKRRSKRWKAFFKQQPEGPHRLLSAEQFAVPLTDPNCIRQLEAMADAAGYELHIVIFIRSQLDYINSRYIYSLRRFYHHQTFEQFVDDALQGKLQNEKPKRGKIKRRQDVFDFWNYFQPLLKAKAKGLKVSFLPFRQGGVDPFEQFILTINLSTALPWKPCPQKHYNRSLGIRGVWLAPGAQPTPQGKQHFPQDHWQFLPNHPPRGASATLERPILLGLFTQAHQKGDASFRNKQRQVCPGCLELRLGRGLLHNQLSHTTQANGLCPSIYRSRSSHACCGATLAGSHQATTNIRHSLTTETTDQDDIGQIRRAPVVIRR